MSETEGRCTWRQRLKDGGLVSMTIWVKAETKARYEALAQQSHRSGSELAQRIGKINGLLALPLREHLQQPTARRHAAPGGLDLRRRMGAG